MRFQTQQQKKDIELVSVFLQTLFSFGLLNLLNRVLYTYMIVFIMKSRADASLNIDISSIVLEQDKHLFNELIVSYLMITSRTRKDLFNRRISHTEKQQQQKKKQLLFQKQKQGLSDI